MLTQIVINKKAIEHNLKQFKKLIGKDTLLMPVVKSNAYGHGMIEVAKICDLNSFVDRICVVNLDEAISLINHGIKKPIMILSFYELDATKIKIAIKRGVIFPVYLLDQIHFLNKISKSIGEKVKVHLKIDTGATRIGVMPKEAFEFVQSIIYLKNLQLEGIWSHFASSEDDFEYTKKQQGVFNKVVDELEKNDIYIPIKHLACSAATIFHKNSHYSAIRLGLSLYGLYPNEKSKKNIKLKPVLSLNTKVIQVKNIEPNTKIGYGGTYKTKKKTKIAILPVGYWDGLDRKLSNVGHVLIKGVRCPIRGRICMNLMMVDASSVKKVVVGDSVTIIGKQGKRVITIDELSKQIGTINYEVVDRINPLIPRQVV
ncbi:MAG: alanine racemase [Candidatus Magasanikbacteria bacterium]|jgi:alanine racemase